MKVFLTLSSRSSKLESITTSIPKNCICTHVYADADAACIYTHYTRHTFMCIHVSCMYINICIYRNIDFYGHEYDIYIYIFMLEYTYMHKLYTCESYIGAYMQFKAPREEAWWQHPSQSM